MFPSLLLTLLLQAPLPAAMRPGEEILARIDERPLKAATLASFCLEAHASDELGQAALDLLIEEALVEAEARRRGMVVGAKDVERRLLQLDQQLRRQGEGNSLAAHLEEEGIREAEFRRLLRKSIAAEWMMRSDFGLEADDPLPEAKQNLWMQETRRKGQVQLEGLAAGVAAEVEGRALSRVAWGLGIWGNLPRERQDKLLDEVILLILLEGEAERQKVEVTAQDIREELEIRDRLLHERLSGRGVSTEGVTYVGMLEAQGKKIGAHLDSRRFQGEILLRKLAKLRFGQNDYQNFYARHRADFDQRFGHRIRAATIFLHTVPHDQQPVRTLDEARAELDGLRARLEEGDETYARAFTRLARIYSEDEDSAVRGGDLGALTRDGAAQLGLEEVLFAAAAGSLVGPVSVEGGVHLLFVAQVLSAASFEQLRSTIEREARQRFGQSLLDAAQIERLW